MFGFNSYSNDISFFVKQPKQITVGEAYQVEISINKKQISGISKFEIVLPKGFGIQVKDASGANFIKDDQVVKFIWLHLPNSESINLSYLIIAENDAEVNNTLESTFHYVDNENKRASSFKTHLEVIGQKRALSLKFLDKVIKENKYDGIQFKVQLGAYEDALTDQEIVQKYGVDPVQIDSSGVFYKYMVGPFGNYESALEYRIKSKVEDAFLVLYFVDIRLSLDDAFNMIKQ